MEENKEKKVITLSLGTGVALIVILIISIIILAGVYYYEINKIKKDNIDNTENIVNATTNTVVTENVVPETNTSKEENTTSENASNSNELIEEAYVTYVKDNLKEDQSVIGKAWYKLILKKDSKFSLINPAATIFEGTYTKNSNIIECTVKTSKSEPAGEQVGNPATGKIKIKVINDVVLEIVEGTDVGITDEMRFVKDKEEKIKNRTYSIEGHSENSDNINEIFKSGQEIVFEEENTFRINLGEGAAVQGVYSTSEKDEKIYCEVLIWWAEAGGIKPQPAKGEVVLTKQSESSVKVESVTKIITKKNEWKNNELVQLDEDEEMNLGIEKDEIFTLKSN